MDEKTCSNCTFECQAYCRLHGQRLNNDQLSIKSCLSWWPKEEDQDDELGNDEGRN